MIAYKVFRKIGDEYYSRLDLGLEPYPVDKIVVRPDDWGPFYCYKKENLKEAKELADSHRGDKERDVEWVVHKVRIKKSKGNCGYHPDDRPPSAIYFRRYGYSTHHCNSCDVMADEFELLERVY